MKLFKKKQKIEPSVPPAEEPVMEPIAMAPKPTASQEASGADRRPAKPRKGLGEELIEIYETTGDESDSMAVFERGGKRWQRMLIWILFFLVAVFIATAGVSWFIWGRQPIFKGDQVAFEIQAPQESTSGKQVTYVVTYGNHEPVSFGKTEIEVRYPAGFQFVKADPEPLDNNTLWDLGSVSSGKEGTIQIEGVLVGNPDVPSTISAVFRYWPANFSSEFQEVASAQTTIKPIELDVRMEGPDQVLVGQKTSYSIIYNNPTDTVYKDMRVEVFYPSNFVVDSTKPVLDQDKENNVFLIPEIKTNQEEEIQINGFYSATDSEAETMTAEVGIKGAGEDYFVQRKLTQETKIVKGDLVVNVVANGSNKDASVMWGNNIQASISFSNNSEAALADLKVVATLESRYRTQTAGKTGDGALDWAALVDAARGSLKEQPATDNKTLRKRTITWTADDIDTLKSLDPKQEGTIDFQIPLYDLSKAKSKIAHPEDVEILLSVDVSVGKTGGVQQQIKVAGNPIRFAINSDLLLDSQVRYYDKDGNQIGSGPLPPKVDQATEYRVIWKLTNSLHEVDDVVVSTDLPDNVAWINKYEVSAGEVIYDSSAHTLTWKLNRIPLDVKDVTLSFALEVTPTAKQIGTVAALTKKITLTSVDTETNGKIIQVLNPMTTAADHDDLASDKGVVTN